MRTEPKILHSGRCYQCGGERPPGAVKNVDPFCTLECCKTYYHGEPRTTAKGEALPLPEQSPN
jgi:hypothetical protein